MDKIFEIYLSKPRGPYCKACATLFLPATAWELQDALDRARLQRDDEFCLAIKDFGAYSYLAPHISDLRNDFNDLNDLAQRLSELDAFQSIAFRGLVEYKVRERTEDASGVITIQDLRDCALTAKGENYHVIDAADDKQLGRFYAENDFLPELGDISDAAFELLDFAKIGKEMRMAEKGVFVGGCYVLLVGEMQAAPSCPKELPFKPDYLFRLKLGLHPDFGGDRQTSLTLPATEAELAVAQIELGTQYWENTVLLDYDGIIPNVAYFADIPAELEEFNEFAKAVEKVPEKQLPKLKALLEHFEVDDPADATVLSEHLDEYILAENLSSPSEVAIDYIHFATDQTTADLILRHLDLCGYGRSIIQRDNAVLSPYGLLHREDFQLIEKITQRNIEMQLQ